MASVRISLGPNLRGGMLEAREPPKQKKLHGQQKGRANLTATHVRTDHQHQVVHDVFHILKQVAPKPLTTWAAKNTMAR